MELKKSILIIANQLVPEDTKALKTILQKGGPFTFTVGYIIPPIPACFLQIPSINALKNHYQAESKKALFSLASRLNIESQQLIVAGSFAKLWKLAEEHNVQIVLTSQPKRYRALNWLGRFGSSTAFITPTVFCEKYYKTENNSPSAMEDVNEQGDLQIGNAV